MLLVSKGLFIYLVDGLIGIFLQVPTTTSLLCSISHTEQQQYISMLQGIIP